MKCIIVDDDELTRVLLVNYIEQTDGIELVEQFEDPITASKFIKENQEVDCVFLDVEMPSMSGLEMLDHFELPQVVLISHKREYAVDAFDYNVTDFLAKPISYTRFLTAVGKVNGVANSVKISDQNDDEIFIKDGTRFVKISLNDILYVEAYGDYIKIFTQAEKHTVLSTMKMMEQKLSSKNFIRIHRSHIINMNFLKEVEENSVVVGDKLLTVSRFYKPSFLERMNVL